jgi:hypothetical protein
LEERVKLFWKVQVLDGKISRSGVTSKFQKWIAWKSNYSDTKIQWKRTQSHPQVDGYDGYGMRYCQICL